MQNERKLSRLICAVRTREAGGMPLPGDDDRYPDFGQRIRAQIVVDMREEQDETGVWYVVFRRWDGEETRLSIPEEDL